MQNVDFDVFTAELFERIDNGFNRALTIGLDDERQLRPGQLEFARIDRST
jgi:hypothetical protein